MAVSLEEKRRYDGKRIYRVRVETAVYDPEYSWWGNFKGWNLAGRAVRFASLHDNGLIYLQEEHGDWFDKETAEMVAAAVNRDELDVPWYRRGPVDY